MHRGYIKLWRKSQDSDFWFSNRRGKKKEASEFEAWLDLIMMAAHKDQRRLIGKTVVTERRGEVVASLRFLAKRWHWGKFRVQTFLKLLENERNVKTVISSVFTHIIICNYSTYQDVPDTFEDENRTRPGHDPDTTRTRPGQTEELKNLRIKEESIKSLSVNAGDGEKISDDLLFRSKVNPDSALMFIENGHPTWAVNAAMQKTIMAKGDKHIGNPTSYCGGILKNAASDTPPYSSLKPSETSGKPWEEAEKAEHAAKVSRAIEAVERRKKLEGAKA